MFQRPDRRQQLNSTSLNSPYFTSSGYSQASSHPSPPIPGYGFSQPQPSQATSYYGGDANYGEVSSSRERPINFNIKSATGAFSGMFFLLWTLVVAGGPCVYFQFLRLPQLKSSLDERASLELHENTQQFKQSLMDLQERYDKVSRQRDEAVTARSEAQETAHRMEDMSQQERTNAFEWKEKAKSLEDQSRQMQEYTRESSRRQLIMKYGTGPYSVELEVSFRGLHDRSELGYITLELAGPAEMPHTVFTFLEQVDQGMYNFGEYGFAFNAPHITQAMPLTDGLLQRFDESGISQVLFPEYSSAFPHRAYTVGLAGRPGGPNIYINMRDNSQAHGPGGYTADGNADPCFGRISRGQDIVDRINAATGELVAGDWKRIEPDIVILSIKNWSAVN